MVDAVGSVKQVIEVALKIKEAADTVRHNKEVCHQIKGRVNRLRAILAKIEGADAASDPVTSDTLKDLEETLHRAYTLIDACRVEKNIVCLLFSAAKLSRQLRQVNEDILAQMAVASFGNNVQATILLTKHFQDPPKDPEVVGLASLFEEDAEDVVSLPDTHSEHDTKPEASDETSGVPEDSEPRIPKMPHASLTWFTVFTYSQLRHATNKFSCVIGRGSVSQIYKGELRDGREVAVKRISCELIASKEDCENEIRLTAMLQHVNVLKLVGYCNTKRESFQVYDLMRNGTLGDHIHERGDSMLPWPVRFQIIGGIAQGLLYLHNQCGLRIIHMDIKPSNILLDDDYIPKIGDFSISKVLPRLEDCDQTESIIGTWGFIAPELVNESCFSAKTDVYGYGVLLLETISGKRCFQADSNFNILFVWVWQLWKDKKLAEFIDPRVRDDADVSKTKAMKRCIHIALLCIELNPAHRPTVSDILRMLSDKKLKLPIPQQPAGIKEDNLDISDTEPSENSQGHAGAGACTSANSRRHGSAP